MRKFNYQKSIPICQIFVLVFEKNIIIRFTFYSLGITIYFG